MNVAINRQFVKTQDVGSKNFIDPLIIIRNNMNKQYQDVEKTLF